MDMDALRRAPVIVIQSVENLRARFAWVCWPIENAQGEQHRSELFYLTFCMKEYENLDAPYC
jgi:hypothetical protein